MSESSPSWWKTLREAAVDTCIWGGATEALRSSGHDVVWAGDWDEDPGDEEILARARAAGRILVTFDKDFGELAIVRSLHNGILRVTGFAAGQQAGIIVRVLALHGPELESGAVITAGPGRLRIRPPGASPDARAASDT